MTKSSKKKHHTGGGAVRMGAKSIPIAGSLSVLNGSQHKRVDTQTFVCECCQTPLSGEKSLLQHVQGRAHREVSKGRPLSLLPNLTGIVPSITPSTRAAIEALGGFARSGCSASSSIRPTQTPWLQPRGTVGAGVRSMISTPKQVPFRSAGGSLGSSCGSGVQNGATGKLQSIVAQQVGFSGQSEALLRSALKSSSFAASPASSTEAMKPGESMYNRSEGRVQRRTFVPMPARGNPSLTGARNTLPVLEHRGEILDMIARSQTSIVEGETGCGKTTQVCQYIVDDAANRGEACSVVCTQPRRISAISVSERVADERGERIGESVGYSVRLDNKSGPNTCLLFCTTGILLRRLETDTLLEGTTHVVVDEVHERGVESDFLLLALRDLMRRRSDIKIVLMSATMDKHLFGSYFGGAPSVSVPGRVFPVEDFYFEDALKVTQHVVNLQQPWAVGGGPKGKGKSKTDKDLKESVDYHKREDLSDHAVFQRYGQYGSSVVTSLRNSEQDAVNYDLLVDVIKGDTLANMGRRDVQERPTGVLVFLSGAKEIEDLQTALLAMPEFRDRPHRDWVLPLHGGLPADDQRKVFVRPPAGIRKIVIATNVAETAITIDDIGYVVDASRMKEMRFDAIRRMSALEDTVVSRTNARQRRGRAGRVAPGLCIHLGLTRYRHDILIDDHQPPEVRRTPLEQLILRIHAQGLHRRDPGCRSASICAQLLEPPNPTHVAKAVEELVRLGALQVDAQRRESLTPLGDHLAHLPIEARLGKLTLYGAAFGPAALDAALTIAAALTARNPFLAPLEVRQEAQAKKVSFAERMVTPSVSVSDHIAVLAAYEEWDRLTPWGDTRYSFCRDNFLSIKTLQGMSELKRSLLEMLSEAGFVPKGIRAKNVLALSRCKDGSDGIMLALCGGRDNVEQCPPALVAALLCAALFPQVATLTMPDASGQSKKGRSLGEGAPKPRLSVRDANTKEAVKVKLHPGSVSRESKVSSPFLLYQELVKGSNEFVLFVRDVTPVPPLALILFGSGLSAGNQQPDRAGNVTLIVDNWIKLAVPSRFASLLLETRQRLDALLTEWVGKRDRDGSIVNTQFQGGGELLQGIVQLLDIQEECAPQQPPNQNDQKQQHSFGKSSKQLKQMRKSEHGNKRAMAGGFTLPAKRRRH